jgi:hypothetical protein
MKKSANHSTMVSGETLRWLNMCLKLGETRNMYLISVEGHLDD